MNRQIVDVQPSPTPASTLLKTQLNDAKIPFKPTCIAGIDESVANQLNEVLVTDHSMLQIYTQESLGLRSDAMISGRHHVNGLIADFISYEPYMHIWKIYANQADIENKQRESTDSDREIIRELASENISAARIAIEATMAFRETSSPTELWNYFDRILNRLEKEFMKIGHLNQQLARGIIEEI